MCGSLPPNSPLRTRFLSTCSGVQGAGDRFRPQGEWKPGVCLGICRVQGRCQVVREVSQERDVMCLLSLEGDRSHSGRDEKEGPPGRVKGRWGG